MAALVRTHMVAKVRRLVMKLEMRLLVLIIRSSTNLITCRSDIKRVRVCASHPLLVREERQFYHFQCRILSEIVTRLEDFLRLRDAAAMI